MKTIQHKIWTPFLLIVIGLISIFSTGCAKKEYNKSADFYFVNTTAYDISFPAGFEKYNVKAKSTVIVSKTQTSNKKLDGNYSSPFLADNSHTAYLPFKIKFGNNKCLTITNTENSILDIKTYSNNGQIGERKYKFTYTYTEDDYNRATDCK